jgi:hypothetical protein
VTGAARVIARQLTRSGETLLLALEPLDDAEFFAESKNGFSAAWVTGHLAGFADLFSSWFDGRGLLFSEAFHRVFNDTAIAAAGPASKAAGVDPGLYPKADLLLGFRRSFIRALHALREFGDGRWDDPPPAAAPVTLLTGGAVWEILGVHVWWHCGELAGSMPRFFGTYALNVLPHHLYVPPEAQHD